MNIYKLLILGKKEFWSHRSYSWSKALWVSPSAEIKKKTITILSYAHPPYCPMRVNIFVLMFYKKEMSFIAMQL